MTEHGDKSTGGDPLSKTSRMKYASLVSGVLSGQRSARFANASSDTEDAAWSLILRSDGTGEERLGSRIHP